MTSREIRYFVAFPGFVIFWLLQGPTVFWKLSLTTSHFFPEELELDGLELEGLDDALGLDFDGQLPDEMLLPGGQLLLLLGDLLLDEEPGPGSELELELDRINKR